MSQSKKRSPRWILVSNRLPFRLSANGELEQSSGGLVSAISGIKSDAQKVWVGCAPEKVQKEEWAQLSERLPPSQTELIPLFVPDSLYHDYYNGLCNDVLWPALHYESELVQFRRENWDAYVQVNTLFADAIAKVAQPDDLIWIHDFHFFLLPQLLRERLPKARIGFFLHVPFPSSENFRGLPVRSEILEGLLAADLVGFHDYSYLRHFCNSLMLVLGVDATLSTVDRDNHTTHLGVFPVSIDTPAFIEKAGTAQVHKLARKFHRSQYLFLGIDRLDYIKGLDLKLKAFQQLLRQYPQFREKTCLVQVAIPTRTDVPEYLRLKQEIDQLVGEINGEFGKPHYTPVQYLYSSVSFDEMLALYRAANALLVTSKRDGMNLVALEYLASQAPANPGLVLLSEFAGALSTLSHALPINPWDIEKTARRMVEALTMPKPERVERHRNMLSFLKSYTATDWAESFLQQLQNTQVSRKERVISLQPNPKSVEFLVQTIEQKNPTELILFLDYDGTLTPIAETPDHAVIPQETLLALEHLSHTSGVRLVVISGRSSQFLESQFGRLPIELVAEHGARVRETHQHVWHDIITTQHELWMPAVLQVMNDYSKRVPNSFIETKSFALAWHYRKSPREFAQYQANKMFEDLERGLANMPVTILRGKKVIEVRAFEANKGLFLTRYMQPLGESAVALAVGDDVTDEDMFRTVRSFGTSIRVGAGPTEASFGLARQQDVMPLLQLVVSYFKRAQKQMMPQAISTLRKNKGTSFEGPLVSD